MRPEKIHFFHIPRTGGMSLYKFWGGKKIRKRFGIQLHNNGHAAYRPYTCPSFVFLRDPIEHAVSLFTYLKTHRHPRAKATLKVQGMTFAQWIRRPGVRPGSFTCFLSGNKSHSREEELELALKAIKDITFIGFTKHLGRDMNIILKDIARVPVRWDGTRHNANVAAKKPRLSKADKDLIKKLRAEDYVLIRHVKALRARSQAGH